MPEVTLRIVVDAKTKQRSLVIDHASDADALPHEHEEEHRDMVDRVLEGGFASGAVVSRKKSHTQQQKAALSQEQTQRESLDNSQ